MILCQAQPSTTCALLPCDMPSFMLQIPPQERKAPVRANTHLLPHVRVPHDVAVQRPEAGVVGEEADVEPAAGGQVCGVP